MAQSGKRNPAKPRAARRGERQSISAPTKNETDRHPAGVRISRRAADRLRAGHLWVYASELEPEILPDGESAPALVQVADARGMLLGTALYSPTSQIALRMVAREAIDEGAWLKLLEERLRRAIERRAGMLGSFTDKSDACRLCFSEADELPGIIADKYGDLVILQLLAKGLDSGAVRATCVRVLRELLKPAAVFERPDPRIRELEGLDAPAIAPLWAASKSAPKTRTQFHLNGLAFHYDVNAGQKTGAFLDQHANYGAAQEWTRRLGAANPHWQGRALDVCCYQGGFALHLARVCKSVTGIDASRASLEAAEQNLDANRAQAGAGVHAAVDWIQADAFEILRDWSSAGEVFDTIVLDPPAFAKSKRAVEGALRGYKELNLRALKMLRAGGLLVTCSCSHHVGWADLEGAVAAAAADAGRRVRLLERRGAAPDHPVVLNLPETEYLKCLVLAAE
jgi:23S rRNA (cytosine1962-C5)-methyltransferase